MRRAVLQALFSGLAVVATLTVVFGTSQERPRPAIIDQVNPLPTRLSASEIRGTAGGRPARAALLWFSAGQRGDLDALRTLTLPSELQRVGLSRIAEVVSRVAPTLGRPAVVKVLRRGRRASVRLLVTSPGEGAGPTATQALTLETVQSGSRWRVADVDYLLSADPRPRARLLDSLASARPLRAPPSLVSGALELPSEPRPLLPLAELDR